MQSDTFHCTAEIPVYMKDVLRASISELRTHRIADLRLLHCNQHLLIRHLYAHYIDTIVSKSNYANFGTVVD